MQTTSDAGKGGIKAFFALLFLAAVVFCAFKIIPVYIDNYELQGYLDNLAVQTTVQSPVPTPAAVQNKILVEAESLGLPVERDDIKVSISRTVRINLDYSVYVDLKFYTVTLHFTPSAENSNLT
ncbi:MAG TPA: hypothetical protein VMW54_10180 [Terriglobia bacterium]|nr:hypothetical protein [Terriglobia bacterium]